MRQRLGPRKVQKYAKATGLPVVQGLVRGGTGHRVDLCIDGGEVVAYWPKTGEIERDRGRWDPQSFRSVTPFTDNPS